MLAFGSFNGDDKSRGALIGSDRNCRRITENCEIAVRRPACHILEIFCRFRLPQAAYASLNFLFKIHLLDFLLLH